MSLVSNKINRAINNIVRKSFSQIIPGDPIYKYDIVEIDGIFECNCSEIIANHVSNDLGDMKIYWHDDNTNDNCTICLNKYCKDRECVFDGDARCAYSTRLVNDDEENIIIAKYKLVNGLRI